MAPNAKPQSSLIEAMAAGRRRLVQGRLCSRRRRPVAARATTRAVSGIWAELASRGLPSCATHTHRRHLLVESAGVFPGGLLFLPCVANDQLLDKQRRLGRRAPW